VRDADAVAYTLEAFLTRSSLGAELAAEVGSVAVPLDQDVALVPVPEPGDPDDAELRAAFLSDRGPVVYVEAEYFGGVGEQRALLWRGGVREELPTINAGLRGLGVRGTADRDEFDSLGLGRPRSTAEWLPPR
jgi:hypothetical protein